jgi:beta-lactam-binding protein with PASTA domain
MKANKGLIIGLAAAGVAIAGAIVFLTTTKAGEKTMKKWNVRGKKMSEGVQEIMKDAKRKIKDLKEEVVNEYKADDVVTQGYE